MTINKNEILVPQYTLEKCKNCNGYGTIGFKKITCPTCLGKGTNKIPLVSKEIIVKALREEVQHGK